MTHNSERALLDYWSEVRLPEDVEWVVVDNASSDGSVAEARRLGARVIELASNVGFGAANNVGFQATRSEFVGFVNPDVTVRPETLGTLGRLASAEHAVVAPQLVNPDGSPQPNGRGYPFLAEKVRNRTALRAANAAYNRVAGAGEVIRVVWLMGAVVLGRRDDLEVLGPWDERFFVYYEDSDLGLRAAAEGLGCLVDGSVTWTHGWARETIRASLGPWKRELASMAKFYARYPRLLSPRPGSAAARLAAEGWPAR